MELLIGVISIIFGILSLVLFFKVWGMCNDVADMKDRLRKAFPTEQEQRESGLAERYQAKQNDEKGNDAYNTTGFNVGDNVIYEPMNRKMIVKEITNNGMLVCVSYKKDGKEEYEGSYKPEQVKKY